jgi:hypothetical protein
VSILTNVDGFGSVFSKVVADGGMVAESHGVRPEGAEVHVQRSVVGQDAGVGSMPLAVTAGSRRRYQYVVDFSFISGVRCVMRVGGVVGFRTPKRPHQ